MLRNILHTISSRGLSMVIQFSLVILTAQLLGAEGRGLISLVISAIAILSILCEIVGGSTLVYFASRKNNTQLLLISYFWTLIICAIAYPILLWMDIIPSSYAGDVVMITALHLIGSSHINLLYGKEEIKHANISNLLRPTSLLLSFLVIYYYKELEHPGAYFQAMYWSNAAVAWISFSYIKGLRIKGIFDDAINSFRALLAYGFVAQIANVFQILSYRMTHFFIEEYRGTEQVGLYSVAVNVAEVIWLLANSFASVLYARVSNTGDTEEGLRYTLLFFRTALAFSIPGMIILVLLPNELYSFAFGPEFSNLRSTLLILAPGIIALASAVMISHFFAGLGLFRYNMRTSGIGMVVCTLLCFILIPTYGIQGAAFAASMSYISSSVALIYLLVRDHKVSFMSFIFLPSDVQKLKEMLKSK